MPLTTFTVCCGAGRSATDLGFVRCAFRLRNFPDQFVQGRRISGGGAPMPLILWTLTLWPLGESRGVNPSGRLSRDAWEWEAIRAIASY